MPDSVHILLVEDNQADVYIIEHCLTEAGLTCVTTVISDGETALRILREGSEMPDLIILDLNLPRMGGLDVLRELMQSSQLPPVPIVILTSSDSQRDRAGVAAIPRSCFLNKPLDLDGFIQVGQCIQQFWNTNRAA